MSTRARLNALAPLVLLAGVSAVLLVQVRRWKRDQQRAATLVHATTWTQLSHQPLVSILVAAWNEADGIAAHLAAFTGLSYPNRQLVLCAGGPDGTYALAQRLTAQASNVTLLEQQPGEGKQHALERCLAASSGEILFLTDADCLLDDASFEATLAPIINEGEAVVTGGIRPLAEQQRHPLVLQQWFSDVYVRSTWSDYTSGLLGANTAVIRPALDRAGGFTSPVSTGTDYHLAKELVAHGQRIRVVRSTVQTHYADTLATYRRRQARWLRNVVLHGLTYGAYSEVAASFVPSFLGLGMLVMPMMTVLMGPFALAVWATLFAHNLFNRARYIGFGERLTGVRFHGWARLPAQVLLDWVIWASVLPEYLLQRSRNRW